MQTGSLPPLPPNKSLWLTPLPKFAVTVRAHDVDIPDPLFLSNIDFQRRGEDELTRFIYEVVKAAIPVGKKWPCKYWDPRANAPTTADKALEQFAVDFRWQMKHLQFNSAFYCEKILYIEEEWLRTWTEHFIDKANDIAHQKYLTETLQEEATVATSLNAGATIATQILLDEMVVFAEEIYKHQLQRQKKKLVSLVIQKLGELRCTALEP